MGGRTTFKSLAVDSPPKCRNHRIMSSTKRERSAELFLALAYSLSAKSLTPIKIFAFALSLAPVFSHPVANQSYLDIYLVSRIYFVILSDH